MAAASPPSAALVKEALANLRHPQWYREEYAGGCPKKGTAACKALFSWTALPDSLKASLSAIKTYLTRRKEICPEENAEEQHEESNSNGNSRSLRTFAARLCELHRSQAAWIKWGTTCKGEVCEGHEWPQKAYAPLLYLKSTSPRQAVILLHFGLLKETDVTRLIRDDFPVALFVSHLLHNSGM